MTHSSLCHNLKKKGGQYPQLYYGHLLMLISRLNFSLVQHTTETHSVDSVATLTLCTADGGGGEVTTLAVVYLASLAVLPRQTLWAGTAVVCHFVHTCSSIETAALSAVIDILLTTLTSVSFRALTYVAPISVGTCAKEASTRHGTFISICFT